jgi:phosphate transport system substrate-binding protein
MDCASFMQRRLIAGRIIFLFACMLSGCQAAVHTAEASTLFLGVSPSMETMARGLIEAYRLAYPQESPFQTVVSSADDIRNALDQGRVSAVLHWTPPSSAEWAAAIGWTGIVFIVNRQNRIDNLSRDQARGIFLGLTDRWEAVGGSPGDIHRLAFEPDQETAVLFQGIVLNSDRTANGFQTVPAPYAMREEVQKDNASIGYLLGFDLSREVRPLTVDGVTAEYPNLISAKYPFRVPVYVVSKQPAPAAVLRFAGWAQSAEGQLVLFGMHTWE